MQLTWQQIRDNAIEFQQRWADAKYERGEAQTFLYELLCVFGVDPRRSATFEVNVRSETDTNGYIDMLWPGRILVEMKSRGKSLDRAYAQAKDYMVAIKSDDDLPEFIMVCDFGSIRLYRQTTGQYWEFSLKNLPDNVEKFSILTDSATETDFIVDRELNIKAAYKMADLHDILQKSGYSGHELEVYLVRLLFCLFADHTGIFNHGQFMAFVQKSRESGEDLSGRLTQLFDTLDTPVGARQSTLSDELKMFAYINGGLFSEALRPAAYNNEMRKLLLECCEFDWSDISPAIFGAMFQGVMDPQKRRKLGAQYTPKNIILDVIRPLILDELYEELKTIGHNVNQLEGFHNKIASLTFLDPACGCGNFLMIIYQELRLLELEIIRAKYPDVTRVPENFDLQSEMRVDVTQFYGIEIEEFPGQVARVGMWLMARKMNIIVEREFGQALSSVPLKKEAQIHYGSNRGNALTLDWNAVIPAEKLTYIIGNPPYAGARKILEKKSFLHESIGKWEHIGSLDYVSGWYVKAARMMQNTKIACAFVSTNSIAQGEQACVLWKPLIEEMGMVINFAYRSFRWSNDVKGKAAVHCVIVGFSTRLSEKAVKVIYDEQKMPHIAKNIDPYLEDRQNCYIFKRKRPICDVPKLLSGNKPIDKGFYLFTQKEMRRFIAIEPSAAKLFRPWYGSKEFINKTPRYCLFVRDCQPDELRKLPHVMQRIEAVKAYRQKSTSPGTARLAKRPLRFHVEVNPDSAYLLIPEVSSEGRVYIPMGFMPPESLCSNLAMLLPKATLYHFGVLTSNLHMMWMKAVGGRLEMRYRYSIEVVYNNFPWPNPTQAQQLAIEDAAKGILDARDLYPECTYADLYNQSVMPEPLRRAHEKLDRTVRKAYGIAASVNDEQCVDILMEKYKMIVAQESR